MKIKSNFDTEQAENTKTAERKKTCKDSMRFVEQKYKF